MKRGIKKKGNLLNPKLQAISKIACADMAALIKDAEERLLQAWEDCVTEAEANEKKPVFKFSFVVSLNLDKKQMGSDLNFGMKYKHGTTHLIPDPDQLDFSGIASDPEKASEA